MSNKTFCIAILALILSLSFASAITGSIGNARMILNAEKGDTIEKYILVKNVNDVALNIELSASGDLENYTDIIDKTFTLEPEEEKKAYFTIEVAKGGTTENKVNVRFTPLDGGNGVGLSSTIIIHAGDSLEDEETGITDKIKDIFSGNSENSEEKSPLAKMLLIMEGLIVVLLIVFLIVVIRRKIKLKKSREYR